MLTQRIKLKSDVLITCVGIEKFTIEQKAELALKVEEELNSHSLDIDGKTIGVRFHFSLGSMQTKHPEPL